MKITTSTSVYDLPSQEQLDLEYILNDQESPLPISGPRVTVGFWAESQENPNPELVGDPQFTICYPVDNGSNCYFWKHVVDYPEDIHDNSMLYGKWARGYFEFTQFTTNDCTANQGSSGNVKTAHWTRFRDYPDYLLGKIISVSEIPVDQIREEAVIHLRAGDGHFVTLGEEGLMICGSRRLNDLCDLTAYFPNFIYDENGGSGDEGAFSLKAFNGLFLAKNGFDNSGNPMLAAIEEQIEDAIKFELIISENSIAQLKVAGEDLWLTHPAPGDDLILQSNQDYPFDRFVISYK